MNEPLASASNTQGATAASSRGEDHELVQRILDGDQAAFRKLFDKYHRRTFAVAMGVVKNDQDALDVVQEAFVKVHKNLHKFQGSSSFYTWLYRIVMNLSIDHIRRTSRRKNFDYDDQVLRTDEDVAGDGAILPSISHGNPGEVALRRELGGAIHDALQLLPDHHRAVIVLREIEGLSYEEIANVLEVPKGTIMSRLFHARRKMQDALSPYLDEGPKLGSET